VFAARAQLRIATNGDYIKPVLLLQRLLSLQTVKAC
jgi:hypothetical protein